MAKSTSVIALFGLSPHEVRVLQTICFLSRDASQSYQLLDDAPSATPDIAIVDRDRPEALAAWRRFEASNPAVPAVMLTRRPESDPTGYELGRPLMATRLLRLLDQMQRTKERAAFAPPKTDEAREATSAAAPRPAPRPAADQHGQTASRAALVVDDSLPVRRQIELELASFVRRVDLAEDGERALKFIENRPYDIIFLDVVLPGMDGYAICRQIKRDKRTKKTPVIMLTGKSSPFDRVKGKLAGCDTYLTKPVNKATFDKVVEKYLKKQHASGSIGARGNFPGSVPEQA